MSTSSAEFSIEFPQPRVTFPISDKITKGSLPAPSVDFVNNQFPAIHDSFQHKAAHHDPAFTDADGSSAGENEDNSRVYSTEYVNKDPQTPIPPKFKVKEDTEQGLGWYRFFGVEVALEALLEALLEAVFEVIGALSKEKEEDAKALKQADVHEFRARDFCP